MNNLKTKYKSTSSEYVGCGHPDKISDQIADAIVDEGLKNSKYNQISCEILTSKNLAVIAGECFVDHPIDFKSVAQKILLKYGYKIDKFQYIINVCQQSAEIRDAVVKKNTNIASGDQGIIFSYACNETPEYLPLAHIISRDLVWEAQRLIENKTLHWCKYDIKTAITIHHNIESKKNQIHTFIFSIQHSPNITYDFLEKEIDKHLIQKIIVEKYKFHRDDIKHQFINSSGTFVIGGLDADSGQSNRKQMIDIGGPISRHGGGGLSGKDLSKVDRLGFYYGRWICKNLVAASISSSIELKIIYCMGALTAHEYSIVQSDDGQYSDEQIIDCIKAIFPQKINDIIELFLSYDVSYENLASHGHVGRIDVKLPWENLDKVDQIKEWFQNC